MPIYYKFNLITILEYTESCHVNTTGKQILGLKTLR